jgi:hypothetical protein
MSVLIRDHLPSSDATLGYMHRSTTTARAIERIRSGIVDLLNDRTITDKQRLRLLDKLAGELASFAEDLRSRLPENAGRRTEPGDPPRI